MKSGIGWLEAAREQGSAFALIFTALFLAHAPLLRLPYFWDEAGYFIPAARDVLLTGSLIPHTTLSNAHPPLMMVWLAFWWRFSAFTPAVTRTSMLLVAAFALLGLWRLARRVANPPVAIATVVCTASYPVFFAQSTLAHLDLMSCALTLWGLALYLERRPIGAIVFFSLAPLAKETAIITPLALVAWEAARFFLDGLTVAGKPLYAAPRSRWQTLSLLFPLLPLGLWFLYHRYVTGYFFGNPEYLRYNLSATLSPVRIVLAFLMRLWHLSGYLNLFVLTLAMVYAMSRPALVEADGSPRNRIAIDQQAVLYVVILAHVAAFSLLGGAVLARYLLPVLPLVILVCVSTLRRRMRRWKSWMALTTAVFLVTLAAPPLYRVAPEDTLLYRDYVILHKEAAEELSRRYPQARILTAWPASDELTRPFLAYVHPPLSVVRIENFSASELMKAAPAIGKYDVVYLFSTKWQPAHPLIQELPFGRMLQEHFFDYHEDVSPQEAANLLNGRIVHYLNRHNEWVAIISIDQIENAALHPPLLLDCTVPVH